MADKKKILIADDFQLLREDLTELINNQRDMEVACPCITETHPN